MAGNVAKPFPGPYEARPDEYDGGNAIVLWSTSAPGPRGQGVFLGFVHPVRPFLATPTPDQVAEAKATAELFAKADVLLKCVEELLPFARSGVAAVNDTLVGDLYPAINLGVIERAEAVVAALKGAK